eukprot:1502520-Prymnesium_polylepis.1
MAAQAAAGEPVQVCRRSGLYKPPRSHFDSVTQRLTLNMDHFCPWVSRQPPSLLSTADARTRPSLCAGSWRRTPRVSRHTGSLLHT